MAKAKKIPKSNMVPFFRVKADKQKIVQKKDKKVPVKKEEPFFRGEDNYEEKSLPPELKALCRLSR